MAPGECSCADGWGGHDCSEPQCEGGCAGHGACVAPGQCKCFDGWNGTSYTVPEAHTHPFDLVCGGIGGIFDTRKGNFRYKISLYIIIYLDYIIVYHVYHDHVSHIWKLTANKLQYMHAPKDQHGFFLHETSLLTS